MAGKLVVQKRLPLWRRLALHSWGAVSDPQVYGSLEIDVTAANAYLKALRDKTGARATITHLVARAVAHAVAQCPNANGIIRGRRILMRDSVDVYVLAARDDGEGLAGVKICDADRKGVADVARELEERVVRLRTHQDDADAKTQKSLGGIPHFLLGRVIRFLSWLTYDLGWNLERMGVEYDPFGSAVVTSVGMLGLTQGYAPLNGLMPYPIVVVVGRIQDKPVAVDGQVAIRPILYLGATFDHRLIDGFGAGKLARAVESALLDPAGILGAP